MKLLPFMIGKISFLQFFLFDFSFACNETIDKLYGGHLQGEYSNGTVVINSSITGYRKHKSRLTHSRPCRNNDKVRRLPPRSHPVQCRPTRWYSRTSVCSFAQHF